MDARAEDRPLTIAIFAPNAPFDSGDARYSFASRLAGHISQSAGVTAEPKAFARASDFEAAVKKGQVDFAVLDAVYLAARGVPFQLLATAASGGDTSARWFLLASEGESVLDFQGKRLAQVATAGKDAAFVDNVLFEGELPKLWGARQGVPDVASGVAAVSLKKADAVFAPESAARGLRKIFDAGRIPNPALVAVNAQLAKDVIDKVRSAVIGHGGGGPYDGWKSAADGYRGVASRLGTRTRRPMMADPESASVDPIEALSMPPLDPALPDLRAQFFTPPARP